INCFRYLGFNYLYDIEVLTFNEYRLRMKAFELAEIDKRYYMHLQAWLNHQVTATKEQGSKQVGVFKKFKEFFDYEKEINLVENKETKKLTDKQRETARHVAYINSLK